MNRPFTTIAAVIFMVAAILHLYRLFTHYQVVLGSHSIPEWLSIVAIAVTGLLAYGLFRESRR